MNGFIVLKGKVLKMDVKEFEKYAKCDLSKATLADAVSAYGKVLDYLNNNEPDDVTACMAYKKLTKNIHTNYEKCISKLVVKEYEKHRITTAKSLAGLHQINEETIWYFAKNKYIRYKNEVRTKEDIMAVIDFMEDMLYLITENRELKKVS